MTRDDNDPSTDRHMVIRVTHIYRRIDGDWRLVHRHADCPPRISDLPPRDKRQHPHQGPPAIADCI